MLASVSKLVDKPFIVGFIVPVLLGVFAIVALMRDLEPFRHIYKSALELKGFTELTVAVLLLWVLAILLLLLNTLLFRMLEGYFGPFAWTRGRARMQDRYSVATRRLKATYQAITDPASPASEEAKRAYYDDLLQFHMNFPSRRRLILPTRFGNVIRAFETYPDTLYGIDGIPGWLRLQGVIPKDFGALVEDAHAQVSFYVNSSFLSLVFAVVAGGRFLLRCCETLPDLSAALVASRGFLVAFVIGLIVSWLAYEAAVERARAWGDLVRSAFDLFLPELAKKMGYTLLPEREKRRRFWRDVTSSFLYNMPIPATWPLATEITARVGAETSQLEGNDPEPSEPANAEPDEAAKPDEATQGDPPEGDPIVP